MARLPLNPYVHYQHLTKRLIMTATLPRILKGSMELRKIKIHTIKMLACTSLTLKDTNVKTSRTKTQRLQE